MAMSENKWDVKVHEHKGYEIHEQLHIWYLRVDARSKDPKRRHYGAKINYMFQVVNKTNARGDSLVWGAPFEVKLKNLFSDPRVFIDSNYLMSDRSTPVVNVNVTFVVSVKKPSEIPALESIVKVVQAERCRVEGKITEIILRAVREALDDKLEEIARRQRRDDADHLARHLAKKSHANAKKIINYEAELAALQKKLEVTREEQLAEEIKQLREIPPGEVKFEGRVVDPRSIEAAIMHANEAFPSETLFGDVVQRDLTKITEV